MNISHGSEIFTNNYQNKSEERFQFIEDKSKKTTLFDSTKPYYEHLNEDYKS